MRGSVTPVLAGALLLALGGGGCDEGAKPAEPATAKAEAKSEAGPAREADAKIEPAPEQPAAPETDAKAEPAATPSDSKPAAPETDAKAEPAATPSQLATPSRPAAPASTAAGIEPPDQKSVLVLARLEGLPKPALAAKLAEAGSRRFLAAVRARGSGTPAEYSLHLLLLRSPEPAADAPTTADGDTEWRVEGTLELHRWTAEWLEEDEAGRIPTTLIVDDHERDGEVEALVRFRHELICPGGGPNTITELRLVELEPTLSVTLKTELHHVLGASAETKATVHHDDLDADGHPDLRIRYSSTSVEEPKPRLEENRWRWNPADDAWVRYPDGATLPAYEQGVGCDW